MRSLLALFLCSILAVSQVAPAGAQCASGTITVSQTSDPGFLGQYKYCVDVSWDLGRFELSHLDVFLALPDCPCICHPQFIGFPSPGGTSSPSSSACVLPYSGEYACHGDPSLPSGFNGPAVKFEPDPSSPCAPGVQGSGTFCFYSPMPPQAPGTNPNTLAIKHGQQVCYGNLEGSLPSCDCALPVRSLTWGCVKSVYR